uniref:Uncharacterized protein n=1 Tax=Poecilia reticulata TaxID=8081 RepID=A0A3P9QDB1_POERE
ITRDASFRARDAFISPSAAITFILADDAPLRLTLALASRLASASAAMALWSCRGSFTSLISTRSTLIPQSFVASKRQKSWHKRFNVCAWRSSFNGNTDFTRDVSVQIAVHRHAFTIKFSKFLKK